MKPYDPFDALLDEKIGNLTNRQKEELDDYVEFALDEVLHNIGPRKEKNF